MGAEVAEAAEQDPILDALGRGDRREALSLCCRLHGPALGRLCMAWLGSQAEADEATQESLLAAWDALADYRGDGSPRAWLFGIARRVCARRAETRGRRENRLRLIHGDDDRAPAADALLLVRQRAERVRQALDTLKPSERDAVVLRFEGELSFREVGECCGIDEAAARKRVSRAIERLRGALGDDP